MNALLQFIKKHPFLLVLFACIASASVFATSAPVTYDIRSASDIPADTKTIVTNAMTAIALLTGGGATLSAMKGSVGLVSGLIRSMFSA